MTRRPDFQGSKTAQDLISEAVFLYEAAVRGAAEQAARGGNGVWPDPTEFLPYGGQNDIQRCALAELAVIELEHRLRYGQHVRVEDSLLRWPELREVRETVRDLIRTEFTYRLFQGDDPPIDDYERRFPNAWDGGVRADLEAIRTDPENDPEVPRFREIRLHRRGGLGSDLRGLRPRTQAIRGSQEGP